MNAKRKYRNTLEFVENGFHACADNAADLTAASRILLQHGLHAPAASLAILAIEELGKLFAIDGLLFARADDHKSAAFAKSLRSHQEKFTLFGSFCRFLRHLASHDPRAGHDTRFDATITKVVNKLYRDGGLVLDRLRSESFAALDGLKQDGFYVTMSSAGLVSPRSAGEPEFAKLLGEVAFRATDTLGVLRKGGCFERYIERARSLRGAMSEPDQIELERVGREVCEALFGHEDNPTNG